VELKPGYKQTEMGVIPEEWEVEPLGSVGHWFSGGTPSMINDLFWNGEIPWVSAKDMKVARLRDSILHVTEKAVGNGTRLASSGAVLMVVRGMILAHTLPVAVATRPVAFNQDMKAMVARAGIDSEFILLWLQCNAQRVLVIATEATHGTKRIPSQDLFSMKIALPLPLEQRAIAGALSDVDELIGALDQLIAKKRDLKQAAMQQLLTGQTRLPGFSGEWEVKRFGDVATIRDGTHQTPKYMDSGIPFYSVEHVTSGDFTNTKFISEEEHRFLTKSFKIEKGDILMTRIGSIGDCKLIDWDVNASFYVSLALLKIPPGYSAAYIAHYSNTAAFKKEIELHSLQSAIPKKINLGPISEVKIEMPPLPEQTAIAEVLSDMDAELAALEQRGDKTRALKQGMMQELLTGRIRLPLPRH
jgi:type I restriction enzyme S subunit